MVTESISLKTCLVLYKAVSDVATWFVLPGFLAQVGINTLLAEGGDIRKNIKGLVIFAILTASYPHILEFVLWMPDYFDGISSAKIHKVLSDFKSISSVDYGIIKIIQGLSVVAVYILQVLHALLMAVMCIVAPIIFASYAIFGIGIGAKVFFGIMIGLSTFPLFSYALTEISLGIVKNSDSVLFTITMGFIMILLKIIGPILFALLALKSPAGMALQMAGKALSGTFSGLSKASAAGSKIGSSMHQGVTSFVTPQRDALGAQVSSGFGKRFESAIFAARNHSSSSSGSSLGSTMSSLTPQVPTASPMPDGMRGQRLSQVNRPQTNLEPDSRDGVTRDALGTPIKVSPKYDYLGTKL